MARANLSQSLQALILCFALFSDVIYSTFPTPFLPAYFANAGYANWQVGVNMGSYQASSLIGYFIAIFIQVQYSRPAQLGESGPDEGGQDDAQRAHALKMLRRKWAYMIVMMGFITLSSVAIWASPDYLTFLAARFVQGVGSSIVWTYSMAITSELPPVLGMQATSLAMAGSSLGEVAGPWVGTILYNWANQDVGYCFLPVGAASLLITIIMVVAACFASVPGDGDEEEADREKRLTRARLRNRRQLLRRLTKRQRLIEKSGSALLLHESMDSESDMPSSDSLDQDLDVSVDEDDELAEASAPRGCFNFGEGSHSVPGVVPGSMHARRTSTHNAARRYVPSVVEYPGARQWRHAHSHHGQGLYAATPAGHAHGQVAVSTSDEADQVQDKTGVGAGAGADAGTGPGAASKWAPVWMLFKRQTFQLLTLSLLVTSIPRTAFDIVLPLYLNAESGAEEDPDDPAGLIGTVFGVASLFYVIGSLFTGRYVQWFPNPRKSLLLGAVLLSAVTALLMYAPDIWSLTALFGAFCFLLIFVNVVAVSQLEAFAEDMREQDPAISERVMALACLTWTLGYALGSALGGVPETLEGQRLLMLGVGVLNLIVVPFWPGLPCVELDCMCVPLLCRCGPRETVLGEPACAVCCFELTRPLPDHVFGSASGNLGDGAGEAYLRLVRAGSELPSPARTPRSNTSIDDTFASGSGVTLIEEASPLPQTFADAVFEAPAVSTLGAR